MEDIKYVADATHVRFEKEDWMVNPRHFGQREKSRSALTDMDRLARLSVSYRLGVDMKATVRKKTYNLDEEMIEKVRRLFNVKTDTEAIQRALQKTVEDREIEEALERMLREGRFRTIYR